MRTSFFLIKELITSDCVLILPDFAKDFVLETDASNVGEGAVLSQWHEGSLRPVAYYSKHLSRRERNFSVSERELLTVVLSIKNVHQMLYGTQFRVVTDHQPLRSLLTSSDLRNKLMQWLNEIQKYEFSIEYQSGKRNGNADALSRLVEELPEGEDEPEDEEIGFH